MRGPGIVPSKEHGDSQSGGWEKTRNISLVKHSQIFEETGIQDPVYRYLKKLKDNEQNSNIISTKVKTIFLYNHPYIFLSKKISVKLNLFALFGLIIDVSVARIVIVHIRSFSDCLARTL